MSTPHAPPPFGAGPILVRRRVSAKPRAGTCISRRGEAWNSSSSDADESGVVRNLAIEDELRTTLRRYGHEREIGLVREALKALIERESARRLARLGGSELGARCAAAAHESARLILVDTSVWVDHFALRRSAILRRLLDAGRILTHPFVIGEIALCSSASARRRRGRAIGTPLRDCRHGSGSPRSY